MAVPCDVTDPASVEALFARISERHGRLDVVFNNAGTGLGTTLTGDVSWEDWRRVLSVNLDGAFLIARGAFRMMRDAVAAGRADHQQRLDIGAFAPLRARCPTPRRSTRSPG